MTKEIQKLAEQAGYNGHYCTEEFDLEMFAELIVRECANFAFSDDQDRADMLKHFGVEE